MKTWSVQLIGKDYNEVVAVEAKDTRAALKEALKILSELPPGDYKTYIELIEV